MTRYYYKNLFHLIGLSLFKNNVPGTKLTTKRVIFLFLFVVVWVPFALVHQAVFYLDQLLFPKLKKQKIEKPFFIVGNFRNGTTMVQRLLAKDTRNFACMKTWELYVAPMLTENRIWHWLSKLDLFFGGLMHRILHALDDRTTGKVQIHRVSMFEPEEDETIFLHLWRSTFIQFMFPFHDALPDYMHFDQSFSDDEKEMMMTYYQAIVRRYLYANPKSKYYLSKNPAMTARMESLQKTFPDGRFLYLMRDPLETVPSTISWFSYTYKAFGDYEEEYPYLKKTIDTSDHLIHYGLEKIKDMPEEQRLVVEYKDLLNDLEGTIQKIYTHFGLTMDEEFTEIVHRVSETNKNYKSSHEYDLESMGTNEEEIRKIFEKIYEEFEF